MRDPRYASIEARRRSGRAGVSVMLSDELRWADWEEQREIENSLTCEPWWLRGALRVTNWHLDGPYRKASRAVSRARRSWAEEDVHNAGWHLARVAAGMLEHLVEHSQGWPESEEFPTSAAWSAKLREVASELRRMDTDPECDRARDAWYALATDPNADPDDERDAFERLNQAQAAREAAVVAAMGWVAEHLYLLWD